MIYNSILEGHLQPFSKEVQEMASPITLMTMNLYQYVLFSNCSTNRSTMSLFFLFLHFSSILELLPPTPSKFHYIFNLRDLSRIFNGLTMTTPERFQTAAQITRVWRNECLRVLYDRLVDAHDRKIVDVNIWIHKLTVELDSYYSFRKN